MTEPFSPDPSLDGLLNALRSAATPEELSGEAPAISAMVSAIADSSEGTSAMQPHEAGKPLKKWAFTGARRVVGLTAIGVLGVAGVAAAGAGVFVPDNRPTIETVNTDGDSDDTAVETTIGDDESVESTMPEDTTAQTTVGSGTEADDDSDDDAADTTVTDGVTDGSTPTDNTAVECADGNHGKTVSSVAKATPPGPGHGAAVSAAAQSDCGKDSTDTDSTSVDTTEPASNDTTPSDPGSQGNGHGNKPSDPGSQGNGHGNGG
jgi:hypothetical protein